MIYYGQIRVRGCGESDVKANAYVVKQYVSDQIPNSSCKLTKYGEISGAVDVCVTMYKVPSIIHWWILKYKFKRMVKFLQSKHDVELLWLI